MKVSPKRGGPSPKAKYSLVTDSELVARAKDAKNPDKGRILNLKPHAYKRWAGFERKALPDPLHVA